MKVIDFEEKGNVIKLYCGNDNNKEYWGDDWDDAPYEHNAGLVYDEYIEYVGQYAFSFDYEVMTPSSDWHYGNNSPFSKEDMKKRKCPCLIIKKLEDDEWGISYSELLGSREDNVIQIYFGDKLEDIQNKFKELGDIVFLKGELN